MITKFKGGESKTNCWENEQHEINQTRKVRTDRNKTVKWNVKENTDSYWNGQSQDLDNA